MKRGIKIFRDHSCSKKRILDFRSIETVIFSNFSMIWNNQSSLFQSIFFTHITHRTSELDKPLKRLLQTQIFIWKIEKYISRRSGHKIYGCRYHKQNQWLNVFSICLDTVRVRQTNKQKTIISIYNVFLWIYIKSMNIESIYKLAKVFQTSCFAIFGFLACRGRISWHVQLLYLPSQIPIQIMSSLKWCKQILKESYKSD